MPGELVPSTQIDSRVGVPTLHGTAVWVTPMLDEGPFLIVSAISHGRDWDPTAMGGIALVADWDELVHVNWDATTPSRRAWHTELAR